MKRMLGIMLLTLFVSLFAGCSVITYESFARNYLASMPNRTNNSGIAIEIYPQIVFINDMPTELTIRATNNTNYYLRFDYIYAIERFDGEAWIEALPIFFVGSPWFRNLAPGQTEERLSVPLCITDGIVAGKYRFRYRFETGHEHYEIFFIVQ